jgi:CRISPR/Cas system-associated exonuclease Cas4 (RecB family)
VRKRRGLPHISKSAMETYMRCPWQWFCYSNPAIPKKTDYPRLCGTEVHRHIDQFYRKIREPRPFFYKSKKSAIGAWFNRWERALEKEKGRIILPDPKKEKDYGTVGAVCIANYWNGNINLPRPLEIESRYETKLPGLLIVGVMDQIRAVSLEFAKKKRPDLIINGELKPGYDQRIIVDLKTEYVDAGFSADASIEQKIRSQFKLHRGLETAFYTYLYEKRHGKKPLGMIWYNVRMGKGFFTYREDRDYEDLFHDINVFLDGVNSQVFPKIKGKHCTYCDYIEVCNGRAYFKIADPEDIFSIDDQKGLSEIAIPNLTEKSKQLKLKLKIPRKI